LKVHNQLHYQNGGLVIGAGAGKVSSVITTTVGSEVLEFEDPEGNNYNPFAANAIVITQRVDLNSTTVVKRIVRRVVSNSNNQSTLTTLGDGPADTGAFAAGDEIVTIGNTTNTALDSSIYMSATDSDNPFIRVMDDVDSWTDWTANANIKVQIGNLESLAEYGIVPAAPGYGFYSDNAYLTGKIIATTGEIGSGANVWTIKADSISTGTEHLVDDWSITGITLATDGSIHTPNFYVNDDGEVGLRGKQIIKALIELTDDTILADDSETSSNSTTAVKVKTITLGSYVKENRTLRIYFQLKAPLAGQTIYGRIYRNGNAVGVLQSTSTGNWDSNGYENISDWNAGDDMELYIFATEDIPQYYAWARYFRVCGKQAEVVYEITEV